MNNPISDRGFMDVSSFRVSDIKTLIWSVLVSFTNKIPMKSKDILLKMIFKLEYIFFITLSSPKLLPRLKEVSGRGYFFIQTNRHIYG